MQLWKHFRPSETWKKNSCLKASNEKELPKGLALEVQLFRSYVTTRFNPKNVQTLLICCNFFICVKFDQICSYSITVFTEPNVDQFCFSYAMGIAADSWLMYMDRMLTVGVIEKDSLKEKIDKLIDKYYDALDAPKKGNKVSSYFLSH